MTVEKKERVVLPTLVMPTRYDIKLTPDLEKFDFLGEVTVEVDVREATSEVTLHARELKFGTASFKSKDGSTSLDAVQLQVDFKEQTVTLKFGEVLPVGAGSLFMDYTGILNNQMAGFYRSGYKDINGVYKMMASTQFEALDARRCFPCWDEPARKAAFAVTLVVDPSLTAFSNMPEKSSKLVKVGSKYLRELNFMDSPKMSSYLVAFVVGEFDFVQSQTQNGVLVRVYTPPGRSEAGAFALEVATKSLDLYDEFFGVPYPLPKLDMVAIPEFAMGAMENWGLVTYREVDLLIDAKTASAQQKQRVCIVVTHELAHQWFGNLVTMDWWDDLWLNEGFASWCENWAADCIRPSYQMWEQFVSDTLASALRLDALESSHPIQIPIGRAEEVEEAFDAVSYCKGASVIRMAHAVMGHDAFRQGLQEYMKKFKYTNTVTSDLWNAWTASSGKPMKDIMSSWTEQMGFPVLDVKSFTMEGSKAKLSLEQSWFLSSGKTGEGNKLWTIPLLIRTGKATGREAVMMTQKTMEVEVALGAGESADDAFVLINEGVVTPMRVNYTPEMRTRLSKAVSTCSITVAERAGLLLDMYALAKAGRVGLDEVLKFTSAYANEKEYVVWESLETVLLATNKLLMGGAPAEMHQRFKAFAQNFVSKGWTNVNPGWDAKETDGHTDGLLRGLMMRLLSRFPTEEWLATARERFGKYVEDPEANALELHDDYRPSVLQAVLGAGGQAEYSQLLAAYKKMEKNIDQKYVQQSIGWAAGTKLKKEILAWATSGEVKIQDFFYVTMGVSASSREGLDLSWEYFKDNFSHIHGMVKSASASIMDACIAAACAGYCSEEKAKEIEAFFEKHPLPLNKRKLSQICEDTRANAAFLACAMKTEMNTENFWTSLEK